MSDNTGSLCPATTMFLTSFKQIVILCQTNDLDDILRSIKQAYKDGKYFFIFIEKDLFFVAIYRTCK